MLLEPNLLKCGIEECVLVFQLHQNALKEDQVGTELPLVEANEAMILSADKDENFASKTILHGTS